jgi:S1-C subfamily serine protease
MRRIQALLITAGLVAAPLSAAAEPSDKDSDRSFEVFEWSMGRGRLGITVMGLTPELRTFFGAAGGGGVLVGHVEENSPAAKAGIRVGDVLTSTNGKLVDGATDVLESMVKSKKGDRVTIELVRDHKPLTLTATLANDPMPRPTMRHFESMFDDSWWKDFMKRGKRG